MPDTTVETTLSSYTTELSKWRTFRNKKNVRFSGQVFQPDKSYLQEFSQLFSTFRFWEAFKKIKIFKRWCCMLVSEFLFRKLIDIIKIKISIYQRVIGKI